MAQCSSGFETGVNGNAVLVADAGNPTAWQAKTVTGATITYDNTHAAHGSLAALVALTAGTAAYLEWTTNMGTVTDHYGRMYLYLTANPTVLTEIIRYTNGGTKAATMSINTSGMVVASDSSAAAITTTATVTLNQWVRLEWHVIHSTTVGQLEVMLFNTADSATATETKTSTANRNTLAQATTVRFGVPAVASETFSYWMDDIVAGAVSYPGPAVVASTPAVFTPRTAAVLAAIGGE